METTYRDIINEQEQLLNKKNRMFDLLGYIKLLLALMIGVLLYQAGIREAGVRSSYGVLCTGLFVMLIVIWICQDRVRKGIKYHKAMMEICGRQIDRITGAWIKFRDLGAEFLDPEHRYAGDLDIIGAKSLFQFLNTTQTWYGRQTFADDLLRPGYGQDDIEERQKAVAELSGDVVFANQIQYQLSLIGLNVSDEKLVEELSSQTLFIKNRVIKRMLRVLPVLTVLFAAGIAVFQVEHLYLAGLTAVTGQALLWLAGAQRAHRYLGTMMRLPYKLGAYGDFIEILSAQDFNASRLNRIKAELDTASQAIKDLGRIAERVNVKYNAILYFAVNIFLLWDYECALLLEAWKQKYSAQAKQWFQAIGEFESLLSLSCLPCVCETVCLPSISGQNVVLEAKDMGHPLLPNEIRVNNDLNFRNNIMIISGSNMSGKTTFMRTVGINLVLARTGGFVCAGQMRCSLADVVTSMRIADNLSEGVSTFYAELKRIKSILSFAQGHPQMLFLIDEIFRGTNSVDRLTGAEAVIAKLERLGAAGIITTHDLELCRLAKDRSRIENYSFAEDYREQQIFFDYKLKQGKSQTTNATFLMKMVGILDN